MEDLQIVGQLRKLGATLIEMKRGRILRVQFRKEVIHTREVVREVVKTALAPVPPSEAEEERVKREASERESIIDWSSGPN